MALKFELSKTIASGHSKAICDKIVNWIGDDKTRFSALMTIFFAGDYRLTQRAAWPMSYSVRRHPSLISPYWKKMIAQLKDRKAHPAARRNILRLLQDVTIPRARQGSVMDLCFEFISSVDVPAADKAFSLTVLRNLSKTYPDILPELKTIIQARWDRETPAFRSRAKKILNAK